MRKKEEGDEDRSNKKRKRDEMGMRGEVSRRIRYGTET